MNITHKSVDNRHDSSRPDQINSLENGQLEGVSGSDQTQAPIVFCSNQAIDNDNKIYNSMKKLSTRAKNEANFYPQ